MLHVCCISSFLPGWLGLGLDKDSKSKNHELQTQQCQSNVPTRKCLTMLEELWLMASMTGSRARSRVFSVWAANRMAPMHTKVTERQMPMICNQLPKSNVISSMKDSVSTCQNIRLISGIISYNMTWHDMTWHDMTWHDMTWYKIIWCNFWLSSFGSFQSCAKKLVQKSRLCTAARNNNTCSQQRFKEWILSAPWYHWQQDGTWTHPLCKDILPEEWDAQKSTEGKGCNANVLSSQPTCRKQLLALHTNSKTSKTGTRKNYTFWHQLYEKPSVIPGCPIPTVNLNVTLQPLRLLVHILAFEYNHMCLMCENWSFCVIPYCAVCYQTPDATRSLMLPDPWCSCPYLPVLSCGALQLDARRWFSSCTKNIIDTTQQRTAICVDTTTATQKHHTHTDHALTTHVRHVCFCNKDIEGTACANSDYAQLSHMFSTSLSSGHFIWQGLIVWGRSH